MRGALDDVVRERDSLLNQVTRLQQDLSSANVARTTTEVYKGALSK